ncbi:MAG: heme transporter HemC [Alphaproteobacteria bacterium]|nr:MAG: heme transporter HemC [Alphaproteobacteria bacterium]
MFHYFANPTRLNRLLSRIRPFALIIMVVCAFAGIYKSLWDSPADYLQGEYVRMMYIHVPAAWMSMMIYGIMASSSFVFLIWRHSMADAVARHSAPAVMIMASITLVTGSLWGRPTWGTYWVWDARLTSMLILWIMVIAYMMLARQADGVETRQRACAYLCLFGAINLPIIKFSVEWWNTLHQPSSIRLGSGESHIDDAMLTPLLLMYFAYLNAYIVVLSWRVQTYHMRAKILRIERTMLRQRTRSQ